MCLAQGHTAVTLVWLEPAAPQSRVKHSTTEPPITSSNVPTDRSKVVFLLWIFYVICVCLFCCFTSHSTAMVRLGWSVHLTTFFSLASLNKWLTSTSGTYFHLQLTTTLLERISGWEENDHRSYFMINLHKSMGRSQDGTCDPWICSQTRICSETYYLLRYVAWFIIFKTTMMSVSCSLVVT